ncbi:hypothetical protein [Bacillus amyloliquefaciens]|uniref:hypothetical protein n=1 Tax=Bacillus amyloliquefaciens TaxID=1390 RepID=UPI0028075CA9|nr:hypothetical protein [Bacillus amyloliquefaciens]MDQ8094897.1 hypothetical protein [Bacillus amyloliquefaciens]
MNKIAKSLLAATVFLTVAACSNNVGGKENEYEKAEKEAFKTSMNYVTYKERGDNSKWIPLLKDSSDFESEKSEKSFDFKDVKDKKVEKYGIAEYEMVPGKKYFFDIRFKDIREGNIDERYLMLDKVNGKFKITDYDIIGKFIEKKDFKNKEGEMIKPIYNFSTGLSEKEKEELKPSSITTND